MLVKLYAGELQNYKTVLLRGPAFFRAPNAESKRLLQQESKLSIGSKKLPIDQPLKAPAIEASQLLASVNTESPCGQRNNNQDPNSCHDALTNWHGCPAALYVRCKIMCRQARAYPRMPKTEALLVARAV